jgi:hypothetical protein
VVAALVALAGVWAGAFAGSRGGQGLAGVLAVRRSLD